MTSQRQTSFEDASKILQALNDAGYESMFAGGCVRDRILKVEPKDFDIASTAKPQDVTRVFTSLGHKVVPTGIEHGTVTVVTKSGPVEITTLRRDIRTDGRHAEVDFEGATFETDAARRDFTINALYEDAQGKIHDFHGGIDDIKHRVLRFVGTPAQRIREDYLRILRFFRFWARLGFAADDKAIAAIKETFQGLTKISQERITSELWGILSAPHACEPLIQMSATGTLKLVLPESVALTHTHVVMLTDGESLAKDLRPWVQLSILIGVLDNKNWTPNTLNELARRLRFSDRQSKLLSEIITGWQHLVSMPRQIAAALEFTANLEQHSQGCTLIDFFGPIWSFFARHSGDQIRQQCVGWLITTDVTFGERRRVALPITGHDLLIACPTVQGAQIGELMSKLKLAFYNGEWRSRQEGLDFISNLRDNLDKQK